MRGSSLSVSLLVASILGACSAQPTLKGSHDAGAADGGTRVTKDASRDAARQLDDDPCGDDNPFCEAEQEEEEPACPSEHFDLRSTGVNVMVAVDGSMSMGSFWPQIRASVEKMARDNPALSFGVDLFWADVVETFDEGFARLNACGATQHKVLALGSNQADKVAPLFGDAPPGPGVFFYDFTVVADVLNHYLVEQTGLDDPTRTNYLVLISDGNDNCFGNIYVGAEDKRLAFEKLTRELLKKNIRVLPIGFNGVSEQLTLEGEQTATDFAALDTIAKHGGTGIDKALAADDAAQLEQAISAVAKRVASCRFTIPDATTDGATRVNPFELTFTLNGREVARDRANTNGWNFVDGNVSEVELFGDACAALRGGVELEAKRTCERTAVCGTAASKVSAKTRAVQYLLDRSLSMADCSAGFLGCVPVLNPGLTWWGVAARALSSSVTSPLNDDVEFGIKYFPDATDTGCLVSDGATVAPRAGNSIEVVAEMLRRLPGGATPLLAGLESVARDPGRLVEDNVAGALIVVSDGGESCELVDQAEKVARLGEAARSLHQRGVKVFAVRFGNKGLDFAEQDAQLRAIVKHGGSASGNPDDPNNVPYLDAPDADALNRALSAISAELSSCVLRVGELGEDADKSQLNLYLDGDAIPHDGKAEKSTGWGWLDAERTEIELFGEHCMRFKTQRTTSIVVEAGCEPIYVY